MDYVQYLNISFVYLVTTVSGGRVISNAAITLMVNTVMVATTIMMVETVAMMVCGNSSGHYDYVNDDDKYFYVLSNRINIFFPFCIC